MSRGLYWLGMISYVHHLEGFASHAIGGGPITVSFHGLLEAACDGREGPGHLVGD